MSDQELSHMVQQQPPEDQYQENQRASRRLQILRCDCCCPEAKLKNGFFTHIEPCSTEELYHKPSQ